MGFPVEKPAMICFVVQLVMDIQRQKMLITTGHGAVELLDTSQSKTISSCLKLASYYKYRTNKTSTK